MAVSAATGLFGQLGRMGVTPQLAVREGNDQARTPVWKLSLLSADRITLKDGEDTDLWSARCKAPPDERGGNRYVRPTSTAPHLELQRLRPKWCDAAICRSGPILLQKSGLKGDRPSRRIFEARCETAAVRRRAASERQL